MQYRQDKYGNQVSLLGFGCMRFTQKMGKIDLAKAEEEIAAAIDLGVNYFDTAYIYPGSEAALGQILAKTGLRDRVYIATKLPHYLIRSREGLEKLFAQQLKRLKTDHIDYYLMHMLTDAATWQKLCALGVADWLREKQQSGQIRQVGFSYHGNAPAFCALLDAYDWDFCQIQYNYMDENSQAGRRGLTYAAQKGVPVVIMEPLRGGKLVRGLPDAAMRVFRAHSVQRTPAQWAFAWLYDQKEVTCVLSGMNSLAMVRDNCETASQIHPGDVTDADRAMLGRVVAAIREKMQVGCTGCGYCMPCPKNVDIPGTFAAWNVRHTEGRFAALREYIMCTAMRANSSAASNCIGCGKCESHCPQNIPIRQMLASARKELESPAYKAAAKVIKVFKAY